MLQKLTMLKVRSTRSALILRWGGLAAIGFALFAVFGDQGLLKLHQMSKNEQHLEQMMAEVEAENDSLAREIEQLKDPEYLEKVVRNELGYLRPNEVVYFVTKP